MAGILLMGRIYSRNLQIHELFLITKTITKFKNFRILKLIWNNLEQFEKYSYIPQTILEIRKQISMLISV